MLVKGMECHGQRMASREQGGYGTFPSTRFCKESLHAVILIVGIAYLRWALELEYL